MCDVTVSTLPARLHCLVVVVAALLVPHGGAAASAMDVFGPDTAVPVPVPVLVHSPNHTHANTTVGPNHTTTTTTSTTNTTTTTTTSTTTTTKTTTTTTPDPSLSAYFGYFTSSKKTADNTDCSLRNAFDGAVFMRLANTGCWCEKMPPSAVTGGRATTRTRCPGALQYCVTFG